MRLKKAAEILVELLEEPWIEPEDDLAKALKLGIEALKVIQFQHQHPAPFTSSLLPGETEE